MLNVWPTPRGSDLIKYWMGLKCQFFCFFFFRALHMILFFKALNPLKIKLLRYNAYNIQFTYLKCTIGGWVA